MNITIKDSNASKSIFEQKRARWKLYLKKVYFVVILSYIFGILFYIIGIIDYNKLYGDIHNKGQNLANGMPFSEALGLVIILLATYFLIQVFLYKKKYFKRVAEITDRHLRATNEITLKIDTISVEYVSSEIIQKIKWNVFISYTVYQDYIFLNLDNNSLSYIVIDRRMLSQNDCTTLNGFINKQLFCKN